MLKEKLEIFLITYNRADYLERTLEQLLEGPFAGCKITLMDNCSPDRTPEVSQKFQPQFPDMKIVRHKKNIGACANYLRAVELSQAPFTWVLCDDDTFDWSDCSDVIEAIESEQFDLISVGSPGQYAWERGLKTTTQKFVKRGARYFGTFTFMPGVIFRTALFDSVTLAQAYRNIVNEWVHFGFFYKCYKINSPVYVSKKEIVIRDGGSSLPSQLHAFTAYVNNCRMIENPRLRRRVIYQCTDTRWQWFSGLVPAIVNEKVNRPQAVAREIADLTLGFSADQRMLLGLLSPLIVMPNSVLKLGKIVWRKLKGKPPIEAEQPYDTLRQ